MHLSFSYVYFLCIILFIITSNGECVCVTWNDSATQIFLQTRIISPPDEFSGELQSVTHCVIHVLSSDADLCRVGLLAAVNARAPPPVTEILARQIKRHWLRRITFLVWCLHANNNRCAFVFRSPAVGSDVNDPHQTVRCWWCPCHTVVIDLRQGLSSGSLRGSLWCVMRYLSLWASVCAVRLFEF